MNIFIIALVWPIQIVTSTKLTNLFCLSQSLWNLVESFYQRYLLFMLFSQRKHFTLKSHFIHFLLLFGNISFLWNLQTIITFFILKYCRYLFTMSAFLRYLSCLFEILWPSSYIIIWQILLMNEIWIFMKSHIFWKSIWMARRIQVRYNACVNFFIAIAVELLSLRLKRGLWIV